MADVNRGNRPLSPHATIYAWPLNAIMSILHRVTGVALAAGAAGFVIWLLAAAMAPGFFSVLDGLLATLPGEILLTGLMVLLWYHFSNGIRHLIWDTGAGFEDRNVSLTAYAGLALTALLSAGTVALLNGACLWG